MPKKSLPNHKFQFPHQDMTPDEYGMYCYALEVSKDSGVFYGGAHLDHDAFQCSRKTCDRLIRSLVKKGWFKVIKESTRNKRGVPEAAQYKVVKHKPVSKRDTVAPMSQNDAGQTTENDLRQNGTCVNLGDDLRQNGNRPASKRDTNLYPTSESFPDSPAECQGERERAKFANESRAVGTQDGEEGTHEHCHTNPNPSPTPTLDLETDTVLVSAPEDSDCVPSIAKGVPPLFNPRSAESAGVGDSAQGAPPPSCTPPPVHSDDDGMVDDFVDKHERQRARKHLRKKIAISDSITWRELDETIRQQFDAMIAGDFWRLWNEARKENDDMPKFSNPTAQQKTRLMRLMKEHGRNRVIAAWKLFVVRPKGFDGIEHVWTLFLGSNEFPRDGEAHLYLRELGGNDIGDSKATCAVKVE